MGKKNKQVKKIDQQIEELQKAKENIEKTQPDSEELTPDRVEVLNEVLDHFKGQIKEMAEEYDLSLYELFGLLKAYEIDLIESKRE